MLWKYYQLYGRVYKVSLGKQSIIVVSEPDMIKHIAITEFSSLATEGFQM